MYKYTNIRRITYNVEQAAVPLGVPLLPKWPFVLSQLCPKYHYKFQTPPPPGNMHKHFKIITQTYQGGYAFYMQHFSGLAGQKLFIIASDFFSPVSMKYHKK